MVQVDIFVVDVEYDREQFPPDTDEYRIRLLEDTRDDLAERVQAQNSLILTSSIKTCQQLKTDGITCPVFMLLETATSETVEEALSAGAEDFLLFPIFGKQLSGLIQQYFQNDTSDEKKHLEILFANSNVATAMFDTNICYLHANQAWRESYQLGDIALIGKSHYDIFPEIGEDWKEIHRQCLQGEINRNEMAPFPRQDGTTDWLRWEVRPWYKDDRSVGGLLMYTEVITEQVNAINAHQEAEARYTQMIEKATDGILIIREDHIIYANEAAQKLLLQNQDELLNQLLWTFIVPDYLDAVKEAFQQYRDNQTGTKHYEVQFFNSLNHYIDIEFSLNQTRYAGSDAIALFMRDISERKLAELVVEETQHRLQAQAESLITINQIADSLHKSLDIRELAQSTVRVSMSYLEADMTLVYMLNDSEKYFELIASEGMNDEPHLPFETLPVTDSLTGVMLKEKRIVVSNNILEDERLFRGSKKLLKNYNINQIVFVPVILNQQILGAVNLGFSEPKLLDGETFNTLQAIGQTLGLALHNAPTVDQLVQEIAERQQAEDALRISEERLKSVITTLPVILFSVDKDGVFTLLEGRGLDLINLKAGETVGYSVYDLYPDGQYLHNAIADGLAGNQGQSQLFYENKIFDLYYSPLADDQGVTGLCVDVSEKTRSRHLQEILFNISRATSEADSLRALLIIVQQQLATLLEASNFFVALYDAKTRHYSFPYWQDAIETDPDDWHEQALAGSLTDYVRTTGKAMLVDDARHKEMFEQGLVGYDGPFSAVWMGAPLKTRDGVIGVMVIQSYNTDDAYDVHDLEILAYLGENIARFIESKQSEEALRISEERFSKAFYSSPDSVTLTELSTGRLIDANEGFERVFGYTREEAIGKTTLELALYATEKDRQLLIDELQKKGAVRNLELTGRRKSGELRECQLSVEPITLRGEACLVVIVQDITERKEAERALQKSEATARAFQQKLAELHEISFELAGIDNIDDVYRRAVELGRSKLGYDRMALFLIDIEADIVIGTFGTDETGQIRDERDIRYTLSNTGTMKRIIDEGWNTYIFEDIPLYDFWNEIGRGWNGMAALRDRTKGIGSIAVDNLLSQTPPRPFEYELLKLFGAVLGYVITGKQKDHTRQQMLERLQLLYNIDQAILGSQSPEEISRAIIHQVNELVGSDYASIMQINDDDKMYRRLAWTVNNDGIPMRPYDFAGDVLDNEDLRNGVRYDVPDMDAREHLTPAEQGLYDRGVRSYSVIPLIADGDLVGVVTFGVNKSEKIQDDKLEIAQGVAMQLALAFRQTILMQQVQTYANNLEVLVDERTAQLTAKAGELEAFTYSVSHDLRSPLRAISGFADVVIEDYEERLDEEVTHYLQRIRYNANRMGNLIDDLLHLSRVGRRDLETRIIQPENTVRAIIEELSADEQIGHAIFTIQPLPECKGDPILVKQLWVNLITNAIKYSRARPEPHIIISAETKDDEVIYAIQDNGIGFDMEFADKLFGVFQRLHTSDEYEGTGIGLATVYRIVERHQGRIWAQSTPGDGATFYFTLALD